MQVLNAEMNVPDVGGSRAMQQTYMSTRGLTSANNIVSVDGLMINGLDGDGAVQQPSRLSNSRRTPTLAGVSSTQGSTRTSGSRSCCASRTFETFSNSPQSGPVATGS